MSINKDQISLRGAGVERLVIANGGFEFTDGVIVATNTKLKGVHVRSLTLTDLFKPKNMTHEILKTYNGDGPFKLIPAMHYKVSLGFEENVDCELGVSDNWFAKEVLERNLTVARYFKISFEKINKFISFKVPELQGVYGEKNMDWFHSYDSKLGGFMAHIIDVWADDNDARFIAG